MQSVFQHSSGLIFSVKTFRPLWVFPWMSSVWRQFPFKTCIATVSYEDKAAAKVGHEEVTALLEDLEIGSEMREPFQAIEAYVKKKTGAVRSYRMYPGHAVEGKVTVKINKQHGERR